MSNRLVHESSPYLQQHASNPVDWHPWDPEALALARDHDKPILLSIGYAACHWCHVMAHESFEDPDTAAFMNEHFVNIKVDREERPDLDSIYMSAVVTMTGQGGWPLTAILTPEGEPFFGGTYYPPTPRFGMPSFRQVLEAVVHAWRHKRLEVTSSASMIAGHIAQSLTPAASSGGLDGLFLTKVIQNIERSYEPLKGGFGTAPKFPQAMTLEFLLRQATSQQATHVMRMVDHTLEMMARGGIYDHIGGGFARYSTDDNWLVPHFEKMLYDNGLLARVYLHAWQITGNELYRRVTEETLDWALEEMRHELGGFFSSIDADSEGHEGRFYVWSMEEIDAALGEDSAIFCRYYGVSETGNWEGTNVLSAVSTVQEVAEKLGLEHMQVEKALERGRACLRAIRSKRIRPATDDKILTSWNGLMLAALSEAARVFGCTRYEEAAVACASFLHETMSRSDGRLLRVWREGSEAKQNAFLEDYSYLADALLALYQSTFDEKWFRWARALVEQILARFQDEEWGGFFDTSDDHEQLVHRPKDLQDNAVPSGNAMAAYVLLQMNMYTGDPRYRETADRMISSMTDYMIRVPIGFAQWLCSANLLLSDAREIAICGDPIESDTRQLIDAAFREYRPNQVVAVGTSGEIIPLLEGRGPIRGKAAAYVCRNFVCRTPETDASALEALLGGAS